MGYSQYKAAGWLGSSLPLSDGRGAQAWARGGVHSQHPAVSLRVLFFVVGLFFLLVCFGVFFFLVCLAITSKVFFGGGVWCFYSIGILQYKTHKVQIWFYSHCFFFKLMSTSSQLFSDKNRGPDLLPESNFPSPCLSLQCSKTKNISVNCLHNLS